MVEQRIPNPRDGSSSLSTPATFFAYLCKQTRTICGFIFQILAPMVKSVDTRDLKSLGLWLWRFKSASGHHILKIKRPLLGVAFLFEYSIRSKMIPECDSGSVLHFCTERSLHDVSLVTFWAMRFLITYHAAVIPRPISIY